MTKITQRNGSADAAGRLDHEMIDQKSLLGHHGFVSRAHKCPYGQFDDLIGTVAEDQLLRRDPQFSCDPFFQIETVAVWIEMQLRQSLSNRADGLGRWTQRIFIGRELD